MPPHEGHDHGATGGAGGEPGIESLGLPVRHSRFRPGAVRTGAILAAAAALLAHARALGAGLVWDDRHFLAEDARVRSLASVWRSFTEPFFTPDVPNEMYRPLVNATLAADWFLSRSAPGEIRAWWFHGTNLLLHALNAALVYVLFANLTKRRLGAPLLAAVVWAMHPLAVEPVTWIVGRCDLLAAACGLGSAILLVRSPGKPRLLAASVALWGVGLFAKASAATLPLIVAMGLAAYQGVEWRRLLGARSLRRFAWFAVPAAAWVGVRAAVFGGWPFPQAAGRLWRDVALGDALQGVGRGVFVMTAQWALPARLCGDPSGDVAWRPDAAPWDLSSVLGLAIVAGAAVAGARLLRRHPAGFPLLAFALALVPVLQIVPIGAVFADRFLYLPMAFLCLLAAEGLEVLYYRWGTARGLSVTLLLFALLPAMSWMRGAAWRDEPAFFRDVAAQYPGAADARYRLALALSATGAPADRAEAKAMLAAEIARSPRPDDELSLLGALQLEDGDLAAAETTLRRAVEAAGGKPRAGAVSRYNLAVCLRRLGRAEEALPLLDEALRRAPGYAPARKLRDALRGPRPGGSDAPPGRAPPPSPDDA